jgi:hypothetical protein
MNLPFRPVFRALCWMLAASILSGTAPHIDEQLHLTIKGEVSCSPMCKEQVMVLLSGTNLGDSRAEKEIATANLSRTGGTFLLIGSVPISYKGEPSVAFSERAVALELRSAGCPAVRKSILLSNFVRDKYGYLLDMGVVRINCASRN